MKLSSTFYVGTTALTLAALFMATESAVANTISQTSDNGTTVALAANGDSVNVTVQDARSVTSEYLYNAQGQLLANNSPERGLMEFEYDDLGRPARMDTVSGISSRFHYDDASRIKRHVWEQVGGDVVDTRYSYDDCRNGTGFVCKVRHDGHVASFAYTTDGKLARIKSKFDDEDVTETLRYDYNANGSLASLRYPSGLKIVYRYDDQSRVVKVVGV